MPPCVALLPRAAELDEEAAFAADRFPVVLRFSATWSEDGSCAVSILAGPGRDGAPWRRDDASPLLAVHRGFLMSACRYRALSERLRTQHGIRLLASAEQHERCGYYPLQYPYIAEHTTRCRWVSLPVPAHAGEPGEPSHAEALSGEAVRERCLAACREIAQEGWRFCVLKDYVKSEKSTAEHVRRFLHAPAVDAEDLAARCAELAELRMRKGRLYRGIVLKEGVPLANYPAACAAEGREDELFVKNEWRLWFANGRLLEACPNSFQRPGAVDAVPQAMVEAASAAAAACENPYVTVDVAETEDEGEDGAPRWIVLELGDGGSCGPAPDQDMRTHWQQLWGSFGEEGVRYM